MRVSVAERLPEIIEKFSRLILAERIVLNKRFDLNQCSDVWSETIKFILRLCALRLACPQVEWKLLVQRNAEFIGGSKANFSNDQDFDADLLIALLSLDKVVGDLNAQRAEQRLSEIYEAVLNMVPCLFRDENGRSTLQVKRIEKAKKRSGSFYSPSHLVEKTVRLALEPLALAPGSGGAVKPLSEVLQLKIVDPAMGAGVFLTHAYRYLIELFPESTPEEKIQIARECLYGVDLDPLAVEVARLSMWLEVNESVSETMQTFELYREFQNLRVGNSLVGGRLDQYKPSPRCIDAKKELDRWCTTWFVSQNPSDCDERFSAIAENYKFFHWEIEFPEVFDRKTRSNPGFDSVIGNPPWEISKPNSREFFGIVDPNYWALGKQDALAAQQRLLSGDRGLAAAWSALLNQHKLFSTWVKKAPVQLDESIHPFAFQGNGDLNLYKLFCEQSFYLTRNGGSMALIVPSGLYSDSGSRDLRRLLLERTNWYHLSAFDNVDGAFDIHRSFKYCIFAARKGDSTTRIETSFMGRPSEYSAAAIAALSPKWSVLSEVEGKHVLSLLDRIYQNSDLLGNTEYGGCHIEYAREFDMTIDSKTFHQRDKLESERCIQDRYGNWLSGKWYADKHDDNSRFDSQSIHREGIQVASEFDYPRTTGGIIASSCKRFVIAMEDVEEVFIPLYEGRMVGQFNANEKHWISGKGRRAVWEQHSSFGLGPQYLVRKNVFLQRDTHEELKVGFLAVGCATNARTMIASCLSAVACGNSVPILRLKNRTGTSGSSSSCPSSSSSSDKVREVSRNEAADALTFDQLQLALTGCLNSFVFDFVIRRKMAGNNLNYFVIEECPLPKLTDANRPVFQLIANLVGQLNFGHLRYARELSRMGYSWLPSVLPKSNQFRVMRSFVDILVAYLYGLTGQDLSMILSDDMEDSGRMSTKGFFRLDRHLQPEDRLPALVLRHAQDLEEIGIGAMIERIENVAALESMSVEERSGVTRGDLTLHAKILNEVLNLPN